MRKLDRLRHQGVKGLIDVNDCLIFTSYKESALLDIDLLLARWTIIYLLTLSGLNCWPSLAAIPWFTLLPLSLRETKTKDRNYAEDYSKAFLTPMHLPERYTSVW